jgi:cytochrome oxidase assembly protein ShyY1
MWSRLRFLTTPRWIALEVAVVAFVLACYFLLAPWQFSRSTEHEAQMRAVAAAVAAPPTPLTQLLSVDRQPAVASQWRVATATGHFDAGRQGYIRLRQDNDGQPAYEVVVPFVTDAGTVLVDRGYVPYQQVQEDHVDMPALPGGTVTVQGRVQQDQTDPKNRAPVTVPDGRTAYTAASSLILGAPSTSHFRGYLQLTADSPGVIDPIAVPQGDDSRPFFSYAIQWLIFGAIAVLGFGYFIYREFHDPVDGEIYVSHDVDGAGAAPPRFGDADAAGGVDDDVLPVAIAETAATTTAPRSTSKRAKFDKSQLFD